MKQAWPASITRCGGFAAGGSVLEHKFGQGEPYTLGVEEEYMLLDGEGFDLVQRIGLVLAAFVGHEDEARMKPELMQSTLEVATPVCRTSPPRLTAASPPPGRRQADRGRERPANGLRGYAPVQPL